MGSGGFRIKPQERSSPRASTPCRCGFTACCSSRGRAGWRLRWCAGCAGRSTRGRPTACGDEMVPGEESPHPAPTVLLDEALEVALRNRREALEREFAGPGLIDELFQRSAHEDVPHFRIARRHARHLVED